MNEVYDLILEEPVFTGTEAQCKVWLEAQDDPENYCIRQEEPREYEPDYDCETREEFAERMASYQRLK